MTEPEIELDPLDFYGVPEDERLDVDEEVESDD